MLNGERLLTRLLNLALVNAPWRRALPDRSVYRVVQGVGMWMPWSHRLPDYVRLDPTYGQNLVELAAALGDSEGRIDVVDVGANIGDSTLQILDRVPARVLAVEPDPYYLGFLERNVGADPAVEIASVLLTTGPGGAVLVPRRSRGTTQFHPAPAGSPEAVPSVPVADLPTRCPGLEPRLIKSDTDGHDADLVPALAETYRASTPVLFFEYDEALTSDVSGGDIADVWPRLEALGYDLVGFWSNHGEPLGWGPCSQGAELAQSLLTAERPRADYLDVVVGHRDDESGRAAISSMFAG